jgi:hypothetical protein
MKFYREIDRKGTYKTCIIQVLYLNNYKHGDGEDVYDIPGKFNAFGIFISENYAQKWITEFFVINLQFLIASLYAYRLKHWGEV